MPRVLRVLEVLKVLVPRVLMVLLVLGAPAGAQNPAPARDGSIAGQVVDAGTGRPVSGVVVSISGPSVPVRRTSLISASGGSGFSMSSAVASILTSADGRFLFRDLPLDSFTITAIKGGYADGASGRKRIGGAAQPVVLTADDTAREIVVRVWKNSAITGTVTDEAGEPVVGLQVRVLARTATSQGINDPADFVRVGSRPFATTAGPALTDDRGVYRFGNLTPGEYIVVAGPPLISATRSIFNDNRSGAGSRDLLALMGNGTTGTSVQVGDALVAVGRGAAVPPPPAGGRIQVYPPTFYPSGLVPAQATTIVLGSGEERSAIDIHLAPVATARVSGTLMSARGPLEMETLRLLPAGAEGIPWDIVAPASVTSAAGDFIFAAVVPGRYTLHASTSGSGPSMSYLNLPVTVGDDNIDGLAAAMSPALRVTGRYQFDGTTPPPTPTAPGRPVMQVPFILDPADSTSVLDRLTVAIVGSDRGFIVDGYPPGRYRVRVPNSPQGWMFKSAMLNGVDVSETPFELTRDVTDLVLSFTDRWSGIGGTVQGTGSDGAAVFVFPTEAQKWTTGGWNPRRLRSTRANAKGQFGVSSLPPGDYYVVAVQEEPQGDWRDPASLDALARVATQVTILEGEHKTIDLRVREVRH